MLSGVGNKVTGQPAHLRRAKSASSVKERRSNPLPSKPIDPNTAHLHALVAAHRAMERSSKRSSDNLRRSGSSSIDRRARVGDDRATDGSYKERVRFSPAAEMRRHVSNRNAFRLHQIPSTASSAQRNHTATWETNDYSSKNSLSARGASDLGAANETYGAEPSSYRRLRKAKSMLTPGRMASLQGLTHRTSSRTPSGGQVLRDVTTLSSMSEHNPRLTFGAKGSIPFLRVGRRSLATESQEPAGQAQYHEDAVQLARNEFWQQRLRPRSSLLFHPKIRRQQKAFKKSVRTSTVKRVGDEIKSDNQDNGIEDTPKSKTRTFSAGLRNKIRNVFSKTWTNQGSASLPDQQVDATRNHFGQYGGVSTTEGGIFDHSPDRSRAPKSRDSLYVPSCPIDDTLEDLDRLSANLRSSASRESLHSAARSRVTSWANSTVTGNSSLPTTTTPLERQRLSIIKEDGGPHQPSSSVGRHLGGLGNVFRDPVGEVPVDSQRIYSALMKRIDQEQEEMERAQKELDEIISEQKTHEANKTALADPSSEAAIAQQRPTPGVRRDSETIRAVSSDLSLGKWALNGEDRQSSLGISREERGGSTSLERQKQTEAKWKERSAQHENQTTFFPFSGGGTRSTTPSPFKKFLEAKKGEWCRVTGKSDCPGTERGMGSRSGPDAVLLRSQMHSMGSDISLYSRTTLGGLNPVYMTPVQSSEDIRMSQQIGNGAEDTLGTGMATMIPNISDRCSVMEERVGWLQRQKSQSSNASMLEWRGWVAREIRGLERHDSKTSWKCHGKEEETQTDKQDVKVGSDDHHQRKSSRFPLLELQEVSRGNTLVLSGNRRLVKSWSGLPLRKKSNLPDMNIADDHDENFNEENKRLGTSAKISRKISPGNFVKVLKWKKSELLGTPDRKALSSEEGKSKESRPTKSDTSSISTPGSLIMMYGKSGNGRLRDRQQARCDDVVTTLTRQTLDVYRPDTSLEVPSSETDTSKRPTKRFVTSISERDRRSSSMLSTERKDIIEQGDSGDSMRQEAGRLGVATQLASRRDYGGLDLPPPLETDGWEGTVTPPSTHIGSNNGIGFALSSKRLVSNFLKSRRRDIKGTCIGSPDNSAHDEEAGSLSGNSPAFI